MEMESVNIQDMEELPAGYILIKKEDGIFAFLKMESDDDVDDGEEILSLKSKTVDPQSFVEEVVDEIDVNEIPDIIEEQLSPGSAEQIVFDDEVEYFDNSAFTKCATSSKSEKKPINYYSRHMWKGVAIPPGLSAEEIERFKSKHLLQRLSDKVKRNRQKVEVYSQKNESLRKLISNQRDQMMKMGFHNKDIMRFHKATRRKMNDSPRSLSPDLDKTYMSEMEQMDYEMKKLEFEYSNLRKRLKSFLSSYRRYKKVFVENHEKILEGPKKETESSLLYKNQAEMMQLTSDDDSDSSGDGIVRKKKKEKVFKCYHCKYSTATKDELRPHIEGHLKQKKFNCPSCPFFTSKITPFLEHMKQHPGAKPFSCSYCDFKSAHPAALRNHEARHSSIKPYVCPECGFRTARSDHLRNHMRKHGTDRPYKCQLCPFTSKFPSGLSKHKKTIHYEGAFGIRRRNPRVYEMKDEKVSDSEGGCETTELELDADGTMLDIRSIGTSSNKEDEKGMSLRRNVKKKVMTDYVVFEDEDGLIENSEDEISTIKDNKDSEEDDNVLEEYVVEENENDEDNVSDMGELQLDEGTEEFMKQDELVQSPLHFNPPTPLKNHLNSYVIYQCVFCNFSCEMRNNLIQHLRHHMGYWTFSCKVCNFVASNPLDVQMHTEDHKNEGENGCSYCDYVASNKARLKRHIEKRHPPGKPLSCTYCDFISSNRPAMKSHMFGHKSRKVWQCLVCNYKASFRSGLKRHLRKHTGERPYHCPHCEFNAAQYSHLTRHLRRFHPDEPRLLDSRPTSPLIIV